MTVALIRTGLVTILEAAGCRNVREEETASLDVLTHVDAATYGGRTHFWIVRYRRTRTTGGAGYVELAREYRIEGFIGVARDEPADGTVSDKTVADLLDAVVDALSDKENLRPGGSLDSDAPLADPIALTTVRVGQEIVPVHRIGITHTVTEDA